MTLTINKATLILTDNPGALGVATELNKIHGGIEIYQSPNGRLKNVPRMNVKTSIQLLQESFDLIISVHCKQLFPAELVSSVRCINVHPGFNPFNRGWYPQVFSLINGLPCGVTIHEMDEQLDHGPIIVQRRYTVRSWDTSGSIYRGLMSLERDLLLEYFPVLRSGQYTTTLPECDGNLNLKRQFEDLCAIDLEEVASFRVLINRLRALTHDEFNNAYFIDESGTKVFVRVFLEPNSAPFDASDDSQA